MRFSGQKEYIVINGVKQGMFLAGKDFTKPVILFLHGGPSSPEYALYHSDLSKKCLEDYFTICYWEQRGGGMSYDKNLTGKDVTIQKLVDDTIEVTRHLINKFNVDKIYLLAHSSGTVLGIRAVQRNPELYAAYIGIGQVVNICTSERYIYDILSLYAEKANDIAALEQLRTVDIHSSSFPTVKYLMAIKNRLINKYGIGFTHIPQKMSAIYKNIFLFSGYSLKEKLGFFRGLSFGIKLLPEMLAIDLRNEPQSYKIPMFFMHGAYDGQVSLELAKQYSDMIDAPQKAFTVFENSAHSPNYEEQELFIDKLNMFALRGGLHEHT